MATLTMIESQAVTELAELLYDFLPASFAAITWPTIAERHAVRDCWIDGNSKKQSIPIFLRNVLEHRRGRFCDLLLGIVQEGINYRSRKGNPVAKEEIEKINRCLLKLQFKIPELHDQRFLDGLPDAKHDVSQTLPQTTVTSAEIEELRQRFISLLGESNAQKRGLTFEPFLKDFFSLHGLDPRGSFRILGEQIDGSFEWQGNTFLVEARWRQLPANTADLLVLRGKAEKSEWTRALFYLDQWFQRPLHTDTPDWS